MDDAGPAKKAGLRVGDIILNLDGESVSSIDDIYRILGDWPVGEEMKVSVLRGGVIPSRHRSDDKTYTENRSGRGSMEVFDIAAQSAIYFRHGEVAIAAGCRPRIRSERR